MRSGFPAIVNIFRIFASIRAGYKISDGEDTFSISLILNQGSSFFWSFIQNQVYISNMASTSTAMLAGSVIPTALLAATPLSSPNTSAISSLKPFIT